MSIMRACPDISRWAADERLTLQLVSMPQYPRQNLLLKKSQTTRVGRWTAVPAPAPVDRHEGLTDKLKRACPDIARGAADERLTLSLAICSVERYAEVADNACETAAGFEPPLASPSTDGRGQSERIEEGPPAKRRHR